VGGLKGHVGQPLPQQPCSSHEIFDCNTSVVAVAVDGESTETLSGTLCEGVRNDTIAGLEANLGLEGVLPNGTNHLQGNVWAVEETSVIR